MSVIISALIYVLVSLAVVRAISWEDLSLSSAPLAEVVSRGLGTQGQIILTGIALFAITNTVLITLVAGSRIIFGMARDKSFPYLLSKVHSKTKTPWIAIIGIMLVAIGFSLIGDIVIVANIAVFAVVITFAAVILSLIVLRYTQPNIERKFKVPVNIGKFPVLPVFGLGILGYMMFQFEMEVLLVGLGIISAGALLYLIFNWNSSKNKNSLVSGKPG